MKLEAFVSDNRMMIAQHIRQVCPNGADLSPSPDLDLEEWNREELESWVCNDEYLYNSALRAGVTDI